MRSEHCNHTMYQFFRVKALKLEAKFRHREEELSTAESLISAKDKEIQDLKDRLKGKEQLGAMEEQLGAMEEQLRTDLSLVHSELEGARKVSSLVKGSCSLRYLTFVFSLVFLVFCLSPTLSPAGDAEDLMWLRKERVRLASHIKGLVEKIKSEATRWNARAEEHNKLLAELRARKAQFIDMHNSLREATEHASSLEARVEQLEREIHQARSSHGPEVTNYIQHLVRERDDARAEAHALSNALTASRADVARMVESKRNLEMNMYRLNKGIEKMNDEVNHLRHQDSMKQVELDESQYALSNLQLDYKKISDEFDFLAEGRDAVVYDLEADSSRVGELEGQLLARNAKLKEAQSSLVQQESQTSYYKGLAGSRDEAATDAAKEVARLTALLSQSELRDTVIGHKARCQLAEEVNKVLTRVEQGLLRDHNIVKNYPRRSMPEPMTFSSGPSSGGSVPSSQKKNPTDHAESSRGK
ncbi:uncharacterized protein LOC113359746 [Papaver somniferum]|uniref:uncharacterized protein LOC113359746 n=1 Tax=Papaver somniferum TaxID=3469 RepID=UPI000E702DD8|nr:uncharacterized protein LOC113359746 [Papaver somniferum]